MIKLKKLVRGVMTVAALSIGSLLTQSEVVQAHEAQRGQASYYSQYYNGRTMSNGQAFYNNSNSCAHRSLRFGTVVRIRNTANGRTASCVVRDRGPYSGERIIDLSQNTFSQIAPLSQGLANVEITW